MKGNQNNDDIHIKDINIKSVILDENVDLLKG